MRKMLLAFFCAVILSALMLPAYAHPGGTDSKGGHRDRSTGEYHYHHGYSAHDHTDMDGDGDLDCPYDFEDKTNHRSESGSYDWPYEPIVIPTHPEITEPTLSPEIMEWIERENSRPEPEETVIPIISIGFLLFAAVSLQLLISKI